MRRSFRTQWSRSSYSRGGTPGWYAVPRWGCRDIVDFWNAIPRWGDRDSVRSWYAPLRWGKSLRRYSIDSKTMPQSLSNILIHLIFSTKGRHPWLDSSIRGETHAFLAGAVRQCGCEAYRVGGVEDHVHLAIRISRTLSVADLVKEIKTAPRPFKTNTGTYSQNTPSNTMSVMSGTKFTPTPSCSHLRGHRQNRRRVHHQASDPNDPHFGLLTWKGAKVRKADILFSEINLASEKLGKNYEARNKKLVSITAYRGPAGRGRRGNRGGRAGGPGRARRRRR